VTDRDNIATVQVANIIHPNETYHVYSLNFLAGISAQHGVAPFPPALLLLEITNCSRITLFIPVQEFHTIGLNRG
jgi:hypothetical protein